MTADCLTAFKPVIGFGKVYGPFGPYANSLPNSQPHYKFDIYGFEQTQALIALLWPWLGPVKRQQAKQVLNEYLLQGE